MKVQVTSTGDPHRRSLSTKANWFFAQFNPSPKDEEGLDYPLKNGNKWRLEIAVYQESTWLRPLKVKRKNQRPRWKTIGYYDTVEECACAVEEYT